MAKDTTLIYEELGLTNDFKSFYEDNHEEMLKESFSDILNGYIKSHGLKKSDVVKESELSDVYCYQIFSGIRKPDRKKLISLTLGMGLTLEEIQKLLKIGGYASLYPKIPFDCVIIYAYSKGLGVTETNAMLFEYGLELL